MNVHLCRPLRCPLLMLVLLVAGCGQAQHQRAAPTGRSSPRPLSLDAAGQASLARLGVIAMDQGRTLTRAELRCRTVRGRTGPYRDCSLGAYARYGSGQQLNGSIAHGLAGNLGSGLCRSSLTSLANVEALIGELDDELVAALNSGRAWRAVRPAVAGIGRMRTLLGHAYKTRALAVCNVATPSS